MKLHRATRFALALGLLGLPAVAGAQGFGLNEIGSCALARGFATTSAPCDDGSSIYWNPGAIPKKQGLTALAGVAAISLDGSFTQDTTFKTYDMDVSTEWVPHFFANYRTSGSFAYGLGVYVPYGLTSQWSDNFPGRFSALKASLHTIYVQPNISYAISDDWSVGIGPVFGHSSVELIQSADLSQQKTPAGPTFGQLGIPKRTEFARATLKGSTNAFGVNLGVHGRINQQWEVGARFLSQMYFKYDDADATFQQIPTGLVLAANNPLGLPGNTPVDAVLAPQFAASGALAPQKVHTQIMHPAQVQFGVGYNGFDSTTISVDYAWVGWKSFKTLPVDFQGGAPDKVLLENYNNTSALRVASSIAMSAVPPFASEAPRRRRPLRTSPSRRSSPSRIARTSRSAADTPSTRPSPSTAPTRTSSRPAGADASTNAPRRRRPPINSIPARTRCTPTSSRSALGLPSKTSPETI